MSNISITLTNNIELDYALPETEAEKKYWSLYNNFINKLPEGLKNDFNDLDTALGYLTTEEHNAIYKLGVAEGLQLKASLRGDTVEE